MLACGARYLKSVLELQAPTGDYDTRVCDLCPIRRDRALCIGAALLSPRLKRKGSRDNAEERCSCGA